MKKIFCFLFLFSLILQAKTYNDAITDFEIVKVRDGDTFVINIPNIPDIFGSEKYGAGIGEAPVKKTVYEIARELEEKYHIVSTFIRKYSENIQFFIAKEKLYSGLHPEEEDKSDFIIANHIKGLWLDFMESGEYTQITGFKSKRAKKENGRTFIDTGEYYQSMIIKVNNTASMGEF